MKLPRRGWRQWVVAGVVLGTGTVVLVWGLRMGADTADKGSAALPRGSIPSYLAAGMAGLPEEAVLNNLGVEQAARGRCEEAIAFFERAAARNPDYLPAQKNLLAACVELGRWEEAVKAAVRAEELHPFGAEIQRGELPADQEECRALRADRDFIANLGKAYLEAGQLEEAERCYGLQLRLFPGDLRGLNGLAQTGLRQKDYDRALRLFTQSLQLYGRQREVVSGLEETAEQAPHLALKVRWVLERYLEASPSWADSQRWGLPTRPWDDPLVPNPRPAVPLPKAPVPEVEEP